MSREEIEREVEQEVFSYGFRDEFRIFIATERLLEAPLDKLIFEES